MSFKPLAIAALSVTILTIFYVIKQEDKYDPVMSKIKSKTVQWKVLDTVPFKKKQDDIFFIDSETGWYGNGDGFIYKTTNGGETWRKQAHLPGTFVRALGMVDETTGFAGNIGPDYFPGVTDKTPLYKTTDGGVTWVPVKDVDDKMIFGVCAIDILKTEFIDSGFLKKRTTVRAAGRVGGPAHVVTSRDGGQTWSAQDLSPQAGMILDIKFLTENVGFICAASDADPVKSHARILKTKDGGKSWRIVYESSRPYELTWKCSFPSAMVGFGTIQSYNPDPSADQRYVVKTNDGGETWQELPLVKDLSVREFGVGFYNDNIGWVGALEGVWMTLDGGKNWTHQKVGTGINKFRIVNGDTGPVVYGIGVDVIKLDLRGLN